MSRPNNRRDNGKNKGIRINPDAKAFAKATLKKYRKENDYYDSKKEAVKGYYMYLMDLLPDTIEFVIRYGHIEKNEEIKTIKNEIYANLIDNGFIKAIKKEIKKGNKIKNIKLLPIIIKEILVETKRANDQILASDPNAAIYDVSDVVELSQMILAKKIKKMEKVGIPTAVAFDILSIIPCNDAMDTSQFHRIHSFYKCIYEHSKTTAIDFSKIMDVVVDKEYYSLFITFALLERKEKFAKLTDPQKKLYVDISNWCFNTMDASSKSEIEAVINAYVSTRKRDDEAGKDANRRYAFTQLSEDEYPKIVKVVKAMIADNDNIKKYLA